MLGTSQYWLVVNLILCIHYEYKNPYFGMISPSNMSVSTVYRRLLMITSGLCVMTLCESMVHIISVNGTCLNMKIVYQ